MKLHAVAFYGFTQTSRLRLGFGLPGSGDRHAIGQQQVSPEVGPPDLAPSRSVDAKSRPVSRFLASRDNPGEGAHMFAQLAGFFSLRAADRALGPPRNRVALDAERSHIHRANLPFQFRIGSGEQPFRD